METSLAEIEPTSTEILRAAIAEEINEDEKRKLRQLRLALEALSTGDDADEKFSDWWQGEDSNRLLPIALKRLDGIFQSKPHGGLFALEHTIRSVDEVNTDGLDEEDRLVMKVVLLFHDLGKAIGGESPEHPRVSAVAVEPLLDAMGFTGQLKERVIHFIRWHDALGDLARKDGWGIMTEEKVKELFPTPKDIQTLIAITRADIRSIPGLRNQWPLVARCGQELLAKARGETPNLTGSNLPFPAVDLNSLFDYIQKNDLQGEHFDSVNIDESVSERQKNFASFEEEWKLLLEEGLVQASLDNDEASIRILRLMGRELDHEYIKELEKKYDRKLEMAHTAVDIFILTYGMWRCRHIILYGDQDTPEGQSEITHHLTEIVAAANRLKDTVILATHMTSREAEDEINKSQALIRSDSVRKDEAGLDPDYEGNGVYAGVLGGFRWWADEADGYSFKVRLGDGIPIISSFVYPKAMFVALCEVLDISQGEKDVAVAHGLIQWINPENKYVGDRIDQWRLNRLEEFLGAKARLVKDGYGRNCVVMETDLDPIVWGSVARALGLWRFVPKSQLRIFGDYALAREEISKIAQLQEEPRAIRIVTPRQALIEETVRVHDEVESQLKLEEEILDRFARPRWRKTANAYHRHLFTSGLAQSHPSL